MRCKQRPSRSFSPQRRPEASTRVGQGRRHRKGPKSLCGCAGAATATLPGYQVGAPGRETPLRSAARRLVELLAAAVGAAKHRRHLVQHLPTGRRRLGREEHWKRRISHSTHPGAVTSSSVYCSLRLALHQSILDPSTITRSKQDGTIHTSGVPCAECALTTLQYYTS